MSFLICMLHFNSRFTFKNMNCLQAKNKAMGKVPWTIVFRVIGESDF